MTAMKYGDMLLIDEVSLPTESVGTCKFYKKCRNFDASLGNGICITCWDKGLDGKQKYGNKKDGKNSRPRILPDSIALKVSRKIGGLQGVGKGV